jgi:hypothetical protein
MLVDISPVTVLFCSTAAADLTVGAPRQSIRSA